MSTRRVSATAMTLLTSLLAAVFAGCGGGSASSSASGNGIAEKSPSEMLSAAKSAAEAASSVHVSGSIVNAGSSITLDMNLLAGKGGRGKLSEDGLSFELIELGSTVYIKGSPAFYKHIGGGAAAQLFQGKWLKASAGDSDFASLGQITDMRQLLDQTITNHGVSLTKLGSSTVAGQKVIGIADASDHGALYIAATGKPYPIQVSKSGSGSGKITFDRWNEAVELAAPANAIDVAQLQHAGH